MAPRPGTSPHTAAERREQYIELRQAGMDSEAAARELGISDDTRRRYERFAQAAGVAPAAARRRLNYEGGW